jgi:hypothetical protein
MSILSGRSSSKDESMMVGFVDVKSLMSKIQVKNQEILKPDQFVRTTLMAIRGVIVNCIGG